MSILNNYKKIKDRIAEISDHDVTVIAVSKTRTPEEINEAIKSGVTDIGENKAQEITEKYENVDPVKWHMIGHLQRNKVKYIIDKVDLIHSVDSYRLAEEINKRTVDIMDVLIQVNLAGEESKFGISKDDVRDLIEDISGKLNKIRILGLMIIAPIAENPENLRGFFKEAKTLFDELRSTFREYDDIDFKYLSMGMSGDYEVAIEEGSNIVRIGTAIFGERDYAAYRKEHGMEV